MSDWLVFRCRTWYWIFWKKKSLKEIKYSRSSPNPENYWCGHQQSYIYIYIYIWFLLISGTLPDNSRKPKSEKILRAHGKKKPYIVNYWWNCVSNYVCCNILVITKIMGSQSASIAWTVSSTAVLYLCWSYTEHSDLWSRYIVYIWYLHSLSLWDMRVYLIFDLISVNDT